MYRSGVARTFQQARILPGMTALENVVVARSQPWFRLFNRRTSAQEARRALDLLAEFNLAGYADRPAAVLSYGQRKLLEFASVLMDEPSLVLLDEPTAGISPLMKETMEVHVRSRNAGGVTFLIVEHEMQFVMGLCDPIVVLDRGRPIACDTPDAVQNDPRVLDAYLGD
jgi:ABC-type branched-subunit amino acid transport system ATPase component